MYCCSVTVNKIIPRLTELRVRVVSFCLHLLKIKMSMLRRNFPEAPPILLKKKLWHRCFPVNFAKFLTTPSPTEHLRWLLLLFPDALRVFSKMTSLLTKCYFFKRTFEDAELFSFITNSTCY